MLVAIFSNSILMIFTDYWEEYHLDKVDMLFSGLFILEACLKFVGMGFAYHKNAYLRDSWNILDFAVVIVTIVSLVPDVPNFKSLRTLRVLRPLRSIN